MTDYEFLLGEPVRVTKRDGEEITGTLVAYCESPTLMVETTSGERLHLATSVVKVIGRITLAELAAAERDKGWRNALTELAEWCEHQAERPGLAAVSITTLRSVANHARERAR